MFDNLSPSAGDVKPPPFEDGRPGATVVTNSEPTSDPDQSIAFLQALDPTGRHNLVAIHPESEVVVGHTFEPGSWDGMRDWIAGRVGQWNLYFSPNEPRPGAPNKKLVKEDIGALRFLFADVDPAKDADFAEERRRLAALELGIARGMMPASFSIDSGNGLQCLWRLAEKWPVDEASLSWAESYGRGLAADHGGDNVQNIERVLRLPGKINLPDARKRARGRVAAPARLVRTGSHAYDRAAVEKLVVPAAPSSRQHDADALVAAAAEAIRGEDLIVTPDLQERFDEALARAPLLAARWKGDPDALPGKDVTGSGWRAALARRMAENHFSALDYARMVHVWTPPGIDLGDLTERNLSRDWGRCAARYSTSEIANQHYEKSTDAKPTDGARNRANAAPGRRFVFESFSQLATASLQNLVPPLIKGVLDCGSMSVMYGESNSGKTFVALDIAFHAATGRAWSGMKTAHLNVVYIVAEGGRSFAKRIAGLRARHPNVEAPSMEVLRSGIDLLRAEADLKPLISDLQALGKPTGLIVVDTLSRALAGGDENASTDMGALVKHMDILRAATGAHLMVIHHTGKNRAKGARGHSLLRAATDTEIEIADGRFTVTKQRDIELNFRCGFALDPVCLGLDEDGDPINAATVKLLPDDEEASTPSISPAEVQRRQDIARAALKALGASSSLPFAEHHRSFGDALTAAGIITGSTRPTILTALRALEGDGIEVESDGQTVRVVCRKLGSGKKAPWEIVALKVPKEADDNLSEGDENDENLNAFG